MLHYLAWPVGHLSYFPSERQPQLIMLMQYAFLSAPHDLSLTSSSRRCPAILDVFLSYYLFYRYYFNRGLPSVYYKSFHLRMRSSSSLSHSSFCSINTSLFRYSSHFSHSSIFRVHVFLQRSATDNTRSSSNTIFFTAATAHIDRIAVVLL